MTDDMKKLIVSLTTAEVAETARAWQELRAALRELAKTRPVCLAEKNAESLG